jgi:hypothetical protein
MCLLLTRLRRGHASGSAHVLLHVVIIERLLPARNVVVVVRLRA